MWIDGNGDGVCQAGEVKTLDQLGIVALNLNTITSPDAYNNGNVILQAATFTYANGATGSMADVLLNYATNTGTQVIVTNSGTVVESADGSAIEAVNAGQTVTLDANAGLTVLEGGGGDTLNAGAVGTGSDVARWRLAA